MLFRDKKILWETTMIHSKSKMALKNRYFCLKMVYVDDVIMTPAMQFIAFWLNITIFEGICF